VVGLEAREPTSTPEICSVRGESGDFVSVSSEIFRQVGRHLRCRANVRVEELVHQENAHGSR
jgi:hypothetical protein